MTKTIISIIETVISENNGRLLQKIFVLEFKHMEHYLTESTINEG